MLYILKISGFIYDKKNYKVPQSYSRNQNIDVSCTLVFHNPLNFGDTSLDEIKAVFSIFLNKCVSESIFVLKHSLNV